MSVSDAPPAKKSRRQRNRKGPSTSSPEQQMFYNIFNDEIRKKVTDEVVSLIFNSDPRLLADDDSGKQDFNKIVDETINILGRFFNPISGRHLISRATSTEEPIQQKAEVETQTEPVCDVPSTTKDLLSSGSKPKRSAKVHSAPMEVDPESEGAPMLDSKIHVKLVIKGFPLEEDPEKAKVWLEPLGFKCTSASRLSSKRGKLAKPLRMVLVHIAGKKMDDLLQISELGGFPIKVEKFNRKRWSRNTQKQRSKLNSHASCPPPRPAKLSDVRRPRTGQMTKQEILGQLFLLASSVANSRF